MPICKREISVVWSGKKQRYCGDDHQDCPHYYDNRCGLFDALLHRDGKKHFCCYLCCKHFAVDAPSVVTTKDGGTWHLTESGA